MHPSLRIKGRRWQKLDDDGKAGLIFDIWVYYLIRNERDHLHALQDMQFDIATYEAEEEYEICAAMHETIENYPQLSKLQIR